MEKAQNDIDFNQSHAFEMEPVAIYSYFFSSISFQLGGMIPARCWVKKS